MKATRDSILIISLLMITFLAEAQQEKVRYRKPVETSGFMLTVPAGASWLSVNPVTNREYITYLCWLYNVYADYPELFLKAFPGSENTDLRSVIGEVFDLPDDFLKLVSSSELTGKYIFNPVYIDYPVMGLTWSQCMNYLAWVTDRYNEQALIRRKELVEDLNQIDENNFNTEAYISAQYEGVVKRLRRDKNTGTARRTEWRDKVFFPAFRLPSQNEMTSLRSSLKTAITSYKPNPFLSSWIDRYLMVRKDSVVIILNNNMPEKGRIAFQAIKADLPFKKPEAEYTFECILKKNFSSVMQIYSALGQDVLSDEELIRATTEQKNNYGFMKYVIIGEDKNSDPILVPRIYYDQTRDGPVNTIFRYAVNAVM